MNSENETVGQNLTTSVPRACISETVGSILTRLRRNTYDFFDFLIVEEESGAFAGVVKMADFVATGDNTTIGEIIMREVPCVSPETDGEAAASVAVNNEMTALPVTDANGITVGVFSSRTIMRVLRDEHIQDLGRMSGILHSAEVSSRALLDSPFTRVRSRLPWLILGLVGSMLSISLVASFEETLKSHIAIAFFIPAIVYLADAVGTQSEAIAVRGLSLTRMGIGHLLVGEITTGFFLGLILAVLAGLFTLVSFGQGSLAIVVAMSLLCACSLATTIGLLLPWVFTRAGWDPALASGPIATVIQDVLSLLIYFWVATALLL